MSKFIYGEFPDDFTGNNLANKITKKKADCLAKYRRLIYEAFKASNRDYFEIRIQDDFNDIRFDISVELGKRNMCGIIETRKEKYIVGGENDPEVETFTYRYLIVRPNYSEVE